MSPSRKRPVCHTCNTPMAGHKRPYGLPICPTAFDGQAVHEFKASSPLRQPEIVIPVIPPGGVFHYINPNYIEHNPPPAPLPERFDSPMTWVSTELADEAPIKREPMVVDEYHHHQSVRIERSHSVASSVSSSSSYIRRIQQVLSTSIPLASMFKTPRQDISAVTRAARAEGLYTALVHQPRPRHDEGEAFSSSSQQASWGVIVGQDAGTVAELADLYERDAVGTLGHPNVTPLPPSWRLRVATFTVQCAIGGVIMLACLWAFFMMV